MHNRRKYSLPLQHARAIPRSARPNNADDGSRAARQEAWDYATWRAALAAAKAGKPEAADRIAGFLLHWAVRHLSRLRFPRASNGVHGKIAELDEHSVAYPGAANSSSRTG